MAEQVELFRAWKAKAQKYPEKKFPYGSSPCCWLTDEMQQFFLTFFEKLLPNSVYLELGSFLGAGSTLAALQANPTLLAICADSFSVKGKGLARTKNETDANGRRVAFLRGKGNAFQHFVNNTWEYRDRIAANKVRIDAGFLRQVHASGIEPSVIYIDDEHTEPAVKVRLQTIKELWPETIVLLDDYVPSWSGVIAGVQYAFSAGLYDAAHSKIVANRLMLLNAPSWL